jgi:DNA polymerase-4
MTARKILHLDLDAFFCAVEEQHQPSLRGKAFAVGGRPEARGVVASCSYAARRFGVRSALPMARAVKLCPDLTILPSRHGVYSKVSRQVMQHLHDLSPTVEQISIDEAFLDVSGRPEPGEVLARRLQATIHKQCDLPSSLGVATNKLLAKIANDVGKASYRGEGPPNAITVVPPGQEAAFLAPLPVDTLWGVGPKTAGRLADLGIYTIGDLARWSVDDLTRKFGKHGYDLARRAQGIDERPLEPEHETKSISQETTFSKDVRSGAVLRRTLIQQSESVGRRLRSAGLAGTTVKIKLRWPDFTTLTRQVTLDQPSDQDGEIIEAALALLEENWRPGQAVRLIGVGVSGLGAPARQLSLWDDSAEKDRRLQSALDELRQRFGKDVLQRGAYFGNSEEEVAD